MPSRFEPCGLAQMQAMAYGTIPVTTDVGGLHDTVIDDDRFRGTGNGFVSLTADAAGITDALHRAVRAVRHAARRKAIQRRGMTTDWSWKSPAAEHLALYEGLLTK
jgi:starch synthase